jgi:hypothetical protein
VKPPVVVGNATGAAAAKLKPPVKGAVPGAAPGAAADSRAPNVKLLVLEATAEAGEQKVKPELEIEPAGARAGGSSAACGAADSHAKHFACSHGSGT